MAALGGCTVEGVPSLAPDAAPPASPTLLDEPLGDLPPLLSAVGLYPAPADRSTVDPRAIAFTPRWELWSNGLAKERHLILPAGRTIDVTDRAAWAFPAGTLFFKTFSSEAGPLETRALRLGEEGWEYAVYLWNEGGTEAALADLASTHPAPATVDGEPFEHEVPARLDCKKCHESNGTVVIGFDELRLNTARAGAAETQLVELAARGVFSAPLPAHPAAVEAPDAATREILGYLHGNCAHCHNGSVGAATSFDMRHGVAIENTVDHPTESSASASGIRVVPGSPEESILFQAFSGETADPEVKPMPPVGVQRRDAAAIERLRAWIAGLSPAEDGS